MMAIAAADDESHGERLSQELLIRCTSAADHEPTRARSRPTQERSPGDTMTITLNDLADGDLRGLFDQIGEFELESGQIEPTWFSIGGVSKFPVVARDGSGGLFVTPPGAAHVVYATSEGQAGVVARDFEALVRLIVLRPNWIDILRYSAKGSLAEMRRADAVLEEQLEDEELVEARNALITALGFAQSDDVVGALHETLTTVNLDIRIYDHPAESLFGSYTIDDNPFYRDRS
jgi:hypothetical protein